MSANLKSTKWNRAGRWGGRLLALAGLLGACVAGAGAQTSARATAAESTVPTLVAIRAANHTSYDRLVFEFSGPLPSVRSVAYVPQVVGDPSGQVVQLSGEAFLRIRFAAATGHDDSGNVTYGAVRRTYPLPTLIQVASAGDFEAVMNFGVSLSWAAPFRVSTLTSPSRVVIDLDTPARTVTVKDYFFTSGILDAATVTRPAIPPATAKGTLQRLFAGPTQSELASGLIFLNSDATGFTGLSIVDGLAKIQLTGGCNSHGGTASIAGEIFLTLKQFPTVKWVKIYDPLGRTEAPTGNSDSMPECLEP
jgi:hypothetical protein